MTPRNPPKIQGTSASIAAASVLFTLCGSGLFACQQKPIEPQPEPVVAAPEQPTVDPEQIAVLLRQAEAATSDGQETSPYEGSALQLYEQVLALAPGQSEARYGLERIVEQYIQRALLAAERRQFASARSMLARARLVLPNHPSIEPTAEQLRLLSQAQRSTLTVRSEHIKQQPNELASALHEFATADDADCRFIIHAQNDAQGRWIYKAMRGREQIRLRAQIQIQSPTRVERQCF